MLTKETKEKRIRLGLCVKCGKPNERTATLCSECWEKVKKSKREDYARCISLGICPICRKNFILGDERSCPECRASRNNRILANRDKDTYNSYMRDYRKKRTQELRQHGLCTRCGKRKHSVGYVTCDYCRSKNKKTDSYIENKRSKRMAEGKCFFCENYVVDGLKVCEECRQRLTAISRSEKAVEGRKRIWG